MGKQIFFVSPQMANPQILGLTPQSQVPKFLKYASLQIANPQICNTYSANPKYANLLGVPVRKWQIRKFAMIIPQIPNTVIYLVSQSANRKSANLQGKRQCF